MVRINFDFDNYEYAKFIDIVGKGNVSKELKEYMRSKINLPRVYRDKITLLNEQIKEYEENEIKEAKSKFIDAEKQFINAKKELENAKSKFNILKQTKELEQKKEKDKIQSIYDTTVKENLRDIINPN